MAQLFDDNVWYRLTNSYTGSGLALSASAGSSASSGDVSLQMAASGPFPEQYWQLLHQTTGKYHLQTKVFGSSLSLDVYGNDKTKPHLATTGAFTGQQWTITNLTDSTFRLANDYSGPNLYLDVYADTKVPFLEEADHSGQHWTIASIEQITSTSSQTPSTTSSSGAASTSGVAPTSGSQTEAAGSKPTTSATAASGSKSLSAGAAAGIGVGATVGAIFILAFAFWFFCVYRKRNAAKKTAGHFQDQATKDEGSYVNQGIVELPGDPVPATQAQQHHSPHAYPSPYHAENAGYNYPATRHPQEMG